MPPNSNPLISGPPPAERGRSGCPERGRRVRSAPRCRRRPAARRFSSEPPQANGGSHRPGGNDHDPAHPTSARTWRCSLLASCWRPPRRSRAAVPRGGRRPLRPAAPARTTRRWRSSRATARTGTRLSPIRSTTRATAAGTSPSRPGSAPASTQRACQHLFPSSNASPPVPQAQFQQLVRLGRVPQAARRAQLAGPRPGRLVPAAAVDQPEGRREPGRRDRLPAVPAEQRAHRCPRRLLTPRRARTWRTRGRPAPPRYADPPPASAGGRRDRRRARRGGGLRGPRAVDGRHAPAGRRRPSPWRPPSSCAPTCPLASWCQAPSATRVPSPSPASRAAGSSPGCPPPGKPCAAGSRCSPSTASR